MSDELKPLVELLKISLSSPPYINRYSDRTPRWRIAMPRWMTKEEQLYIESGLGLSPFDHSFVDNAKGDGHQLNVVYTGKCYGQCIETVTQHVAQYAQAGSLECRIEEALG